MSKLYGTVDGAARTQASRRGHRHLVTHAACWEGAIRTELTYNEDGTTSYVVLLTPWRGSGGITRVLSKGRLDSTGELDGNGILQFRRGESV